MNQVRRLVDKLEKMRQKTEEKIEKIQKKCKHRHTKRWSDYGGINEQCEKCDKWLR